MSDNENDYVATAAAEKRLREVLTDRLHDVCEEDRGGITADNLAHILLTGAKIEYKARAKQVTITLDLPEKASPKSEPKAPDRDTPEGYADAEMQVTTPAPPTPHLVPFTPAYDTNADYFD